MTPDKKVALITGANRGLGFETAKQLGEQGITVVLGGRKLKSAEEAAGKLKLEGIDAYGIQLDVVSQADRVAAAKYLEGKFGKLDILVNNAGIGSSSGLANVTSQVTDEDLQTVFATNLFAVVALTRELLPLIQKSPGGRIVNLSSILGSLTLHASAEGLGVMPFAYDASKSALNAYTVHLAKELKSTPIKVNSVHPGWVKTELGTDAAPMEIPDGAKTSVDAALLGPDGPTGSFFHLDKTLPW